MTLCRLPSFFSSSAIHCRPSRSLQTVDIGIITVFIIRLPHTGRAGRCKKPLSAPDILQRSMLLCTPGKSVDLQSERISLSRRCRPTVSKPHIPALCRTILPKSSRSYIETAFLYPIHKLKAVFSFPASSLVLYRSLPAGPPPFLSIRPPWRLVLSSSHRSVPLSWPYGQHLSFALSGNPAPCAAT